LLWFSAVPGKSKTKRRSGCPVSASLEIFGDRWSLLIVRDMMIRGHRTFKEFEQSGEGIATNVLADRLRKLASAQIIRSQVNRADARKLDYRLTKKGIDLAPLLLEFLIWGGRHEETDASCAMIEQMAASRERLLAEVRVRWENDDPAPLQVNGRWVWP
jgi:DNA-binding HxlR family transcriptional regulator